MLSFASGIMLYISYADLLPHAVAGMGFGSDEPGHEGHGHGSLDGFRDANLWMFCGMVRVRRVAARPLVLLAAAPAASLRSASPTAPARPPPRRRSCFSSSLRAFPRSRWARAPTTTTPSATPT